MENLDFEKFGCWGWGDSSRRKWDIPDDVYCCWLTMDKTNHLLPAWFAEIKHFLYFLTQQSWPQVEYGSRIVNWYFFLEIRHEIHEEMCCDEIVTDRGNCVICTSGVVVAGRISFLQLGNILGIWYLVFFTNYPVISQLSYRKYRNVWRYMWGTWEVDLNIW